MGNGFFLISDIHLEKKNEKARQYLLDAINERMRGSGKPLAVAGDAANGIEALRWFSKIEGTVVYVCGNHEFWRGDYGETVLAIRSSAPENVVFLHNDFAEVGNLTFVGGTGWSDLGAKLNPDLLREAAYTMADIREITFGEWHARKGNDARLLSFLGRKNESIAKESIRRKEWNVLAEVEENAKSFGFMRDFLEVWSSLRSADVEMRALTSRLEMSHAKSKIAFYALSAEKYEESMAKLDYSKYSSFREWIGATRRAAQASEVESENRERIFERLRGGGTNGRRLVMLTHHLPFLEEELIGHSRWSEKGLGKGLLAEVNMDLFKVRSGAEYPQHNYLYRARRGEFAPNDDLLKIIHYANDGSSWIPPELLKEVSVWAHGHDHSKSFVHSLKGVQIATNPLGLGMSHLDFSEDSIRHGESRRDEEFLMDVNADLCGEELSVASEMWLLSNFDFETHRRLLEEALSAVETVESMLRAAYGELESSFSSVLDEDERSIVELSMDAADLRMGKAAEMESKLTRAAEVMMNPETTMERLAFGLKGNESFGMEKYLRFYENGRQPFDRTENDFGNPNGGYTTSMGYLLHSTIRTRIALRADLEKAKATADAISSTKMASMGEADSEKVAVFSAKELHEGFKHFFELEDAVRKEMSEVRLKKSSKNCL